MSPDIPALDREAAGIRTAGEIAGWWPRYRDACLAERERRELELEQAETQEELETINA